ncbi:hypothetical protein ACJX0J_012110, partial [Zea mays]
YVSLFPTFTLMAKAAAAMFSYDPPSLLYLVDMPGTTIFQSRGASLVWLYLIFYMIHHFSKKIWSLGSCITDLAPFLAFSLWLKDARIT